MQLFVRRSKHVPQKIRKNWDKLNLHYMSEEEDTENGDNKILVKKLPWRSDSKCSNFHVCVLHVLTVSFSIFFFRA